MKNFCCVVKLTGAGFRREPTMPKQFGSCENGNGHRARLPCRFTSSGYDEAALSISLSQGFAVSRSLRTALRHKVSRNMVGALSSVPGANVARWQQFPRHGEGKRTARQGAGCGFLSGLPLSLASQLSRGEGWEGFLFRFFSLF
jgi:hypothetical protein